MRLLSQLVVIALALSASQASALFLDANGFYGLRGEYNTNPGFNADAQRYQAIEHSFRFTLDGRLHEKASVMLEMRIDDNLGSAYLGDESKGPETQDPLAPEYKPYYPSFTKAYVRYAFDYCILEAGRRGRDWGLGLYLDSGSNPFETDASIFDGISCDINIQKFQTLGFSVGYDKLQESVPNDTAVLTKSRRSGATFGDDDVDQIYLTVTYDDRKANQGAMVTKEIGMYFSYIDSNDFETSLKMIDLYSNINISKFTWKNEFLFRIGTSKNPALSRLGGYAPVTVGGEKKTVKTNSIAVAGKFEYELSRQGTLKGPEEYHEGDLTRHVLFADYAYAPGNNQGYKAANDRDAETKAVAFHRNYKPALILFNEPEELNNLAIDGVFNPDYIMNAMVFGLGYRWENASWGNVETKLITGRLVESMPKAIKASATKHLVGYGGSNLGYELDLKYDFPINRYATLGINGAYALGGDAWVGAKGEKQVDRYMGQAYLNFTF